MTGFFRWLGRLWQRILWYIGGIAIVAIPIIARLWEVGTLIVRTSLIVLLAFPLLITIVAFVGAPWLVATVTILVFVAMLGAGIISINPLLIGILATNSRVRNGLKRIAGVLAIELLVGVYFTLMSPFLKVGATLVILLLFFSLFFLALAEQVSFTKAMRAILVLILICISGLSIVSYIAPRFFIGVPGLSNLGIFYKQTGAEKEITSTENWLQDKWDDRTQARLDSVKQEYENGDIDLDSALVLTKLIKEQSENFRRKIAGIPPTPKIISQSLGKIVTTAQQDTLKKTYTVPVNGWSETINVCPYRHFIIDPTDSVRVKFDDKSGFTTYPDDGSTRKVSSGTFALQALHLGTQVTVKMYN